MRRVVIAKSLPIGTTEDTEERQSEKKTIKVKRKD